MARQSLAISVGSEGAPDVVTSSSPRSPSSSSSDIPLLQHSKAAVDYPPERLLMELDRLLLANLHYAFAVWAGSYFNCACKWPERRQIGEGKPAISQGKLGK